MRVSEIAGHLNAAWEGDGMLEVSGAAPLESADVQEIAFAGNRKAAALAADSRAGCLLVTDDFPKGRTIIRVAEPRAAFARTIALLYPPLPVIAGIHHSATIAPLARIAKSAAVGPHVSIAENSHVGERSAIGAGCSIGSGVSIGDDCILHA